MVTEPVLNILLSEYFARGLAKALRIPESRVKILKGKIKTTGQPDIQLIDALGVRVIIEGKIGDLNQAIKDCQKRIDDGLADICFAVSYPESLGNIEDIIEVRDAIPTARLEIALVKPPTQLTLEGWPDESIKRLGTMQSYQLLEMLGSQSIYDEIVGTESAERIAEIIETVLKSVRRMPKPSLISMDKRLSKVLQAVSGAEESEVDQQ